MEAFKAILNVAPCGQMGGIVLKEPVQYVTAVIMTMLQTIRWAAWPLVVGHGTASWLYRVCEIGWRTQGKRGEAGCLQRIVTR